MLLRLLPPILLLLCFVGAQAQTLQPAAQTAEQVRIERLVGLSKIWGTVKYFHPYLGYRVIDWDKALVETIPKVNAARNAEEYEAAVNSMLAVLGDATTRARIAGVKAEAKSRAPEAENKEPIRLEDGVLLIDAPAVAKVYRREANRRGELVSATHGLSQKAKAILFDLRTTPEGAGEGSDYFLGAYLWDVLPQVLDRDVTLSSLRYRVHSGYAPQIGSTSGGYFSAMTTNAPETLGGNSKAKTPPIVFLVNENSQAAVMIGGLQAAKLAFVIQDGGDSETVGAVTTAMRLPENLEVRVRTAELVNPDGSVGFAADLLAPPGGAALAARRAIAENRFVSDRAKTASASASQVSQKEKIYAEMEFPAAEYRLLALFRYWNVINYFFPYKDLIGADWNDVLPKYIPKFEANKDAVDYQMTVREMAAEMRDSHGGVRNARALEAKLGNYEPPVLVRNVENQTVVFKVLDDKLPLKTGDVVLTVDGEDIGKRREFFSRITAASTPQALMRSVHYNLLRGQKGTTAKLTVRGADGQVRAVETPRTLDRNDPKAYEMGLRSTPAVAVLPGGFGYVDLERLTVAQVDEMFETIKNTPATIFDMRGYPQGTAWAIAPRLTTKKSPVGALFSRPLREGLLLYNSESLTIDYALRQTLPPAEGGVYRGGVVMLINEYAFSQAEHTALFFEVARPEVVFIGTPTTGANGDVTRMVLPGNLTVSFSGHSVRHADGRQLQRIGVQPTVRVEPTIRGMRDGRDEVLEAAVSFLQAKEAKK